MTKGRQHSKSVAVSQEPILDLEDDQAKGLNPSLLQAFLSDAPAEDGSPSPADNKGKKPLGVRIYRDLRGRLDFFAFSPRPRFYKGDQTSVPSFVASIVVLLVTIGYAASTFQEFLNPVPKTSTAETEDTSLSAVMPPFSVRVIHHADAMDPYSIRPLMTLDKSYVTVNAFIRSFGWTTTPRYWDTTRVNSVKIPLHRCDGRHNVSRRTTLTDPWCPGEVDGHCPAAVLCPDLDKLKQFPLSRSCRAVENCSRLEVILEHCQKPPELEPVPGSFPPGYVYPYTWTPYPLPTSWDVKLVGPPGADYGRVALRPVGPGVPTDAPYGIVCNDMANATFAETVCRAVGKSARYARILPSGEFPSCKLTNECHFYMDDWACFSNPAFSTNRSFTNANRTLQDCYFRYWPPGVEQNNCGWYEELGVACPSEPPKLQMRLVNSSRPDKGLLQVRFADDDTSGSTAASTPSMSATTSTSGILSDEGWYTMCRRNFTVADATAACRLMGFNVTVGAIVPEGEYGTASQGNMLVVANSTCGQEGTPFNHCAQLSSGDELVRACRYNDIALDCSLVHHETDWEYKLVDVVADPLTGKARPPTKPGRGVLLVKPPGQTHFGGVCTIGFSGMEAAAACRSLGYVVNSARVLRVFRNASVLRADTMYVEEANCGANATYFDQCTKTVYDFDPKNRNHTYDCGGLAGANYYVSHRFRRVMSNLAMIDCNEPCADINDIYGVLGNAYFSTTTTMPTDGGDAQNHTRMFKLSGSLQGRRETFMSLREITSTPDYFRRFTNERQTMLQIDDDSLSAVGAFDIRTIKGTKEALGNQETVSEEEDSGIEGSATAVVPPTFVEVFAMNSKFLREQRQYDSILDILGTVNALRGALILLVAWIFANYNEIRFYRLNPMWDKFGRSFRRRTTVVDPAVTGTLDVRLAQNQTPNDTDDESTAENRHSAEMALIQQP